MEIGYVAVHTWLASVGAIGTFGFVAIAGEVVEEDDIGSLFMILVCWLSGSHG